MLEPMRYADLLADGGKGGVHGERAADGRALSDELGDRTVGTRRLRSRACEIAAVPR